MEIRSKSKLSAISSESKLLAHYSLHLFNWNSVTQIVVNLFLSEVIKNVYFLICGFFFF